MKEFILKLLNSSDEVSSKRFISLVSFIIFISIVVCDLCGIMISEYLTYIVVSLILGNQALTLFGKGNSNIPTIDLSDIISENVTKVQGFKHEEGKEENDTTKD